MADETGYRSLTLRGALNGALRTATYRSREHVVVPVVALVEGVVHAVNAPAPELVLATEFSRALAAWNGEPVMLNHPTVNGSQVSANTPDLLDSWQLGQVFNTRVEGSRLLMDAYVDPTRVDIVGEQARDLMSTLEAGGTIEVSVGAFITLERKSGAFKGRPYTAVWRDIVPDHLALLPNGTTGACSVENGCGAGVSRAAAGKHLVTAEGITIEEAPSMPQTSASGGHKSLRERMKDFLTSFRTEVSVEDLSDNDLRRKLDQYLRPIEPGYLGIDEVYPLDNRFIYAITLADTVKLFQRSFTLADDGEISLSDDRQEVEPVTTFQPVVTTAAASETPCRCHEHHDEQQDPQSAVSAEERTVHKNAERITALIANPKTSWSEQDRAHLETQTDERLATLESAVAEPVTPVKPELTLADLPEGWRKAIEAQAALELAEKTQTVETLAANQSVFTKSELDAMPVETLKKMATLAGTPAPTAPVTFATRQAATRTAADSAAPAPLDYNAAIRTAQSKRQ